MTTPDALAGYMDDTSFDNYGVIIDYLLEHIPDLQHPASIRTYAQMRHDPQLASILAVYGGAIDRAQKSIDPAGCRDEVVQRIADETGLPIKDVDPEPKGARRRRFSIDEHFRIAGLYRVFGHMFFAQQWDEQYRLTTVQERMPQTIDGLKFNDDSTLKGVTQYRRAGQEQQSIITTADHRLVYYTRNREGANYFGQSLLRPSYAPWLIKTEMLRVHATSIRRFGMGVPGFEPLPGASITPQQEAVAQRALGSLRAAERSHMVPPPGYRYTLTGMTGSVPDAVEFINLLDRYMTRSTLTSILDMATAEKGNRSLGDTVLDLMTYAQQSDGNFLAATATEQIVIPLVDALYGENEPAPRIVCGDVSADTELSADEQANLLHYGGLQADKPYRAWVRKTNGIPDEDPDYVPPAKTPAPTPPNGGTDA